jgi:hypothetical protein
MPILEAEHATPPPQHSRATNLSAHSYRRVLVAANAPDPVQMPSVSVSARPAAQAELREIALKCAPQFRTDWNRPR